MVALLIGLNLWVMFALAFESERMRGVWMVLEGGGGGGGEEGWGWWYLMGKWRCWALSNRRAGWKEERRLGGMDEW